MPSNGDDLYFGGISKSSVSNRPAKSIVIHHSKEPIDVQSVKKMMCVRMTVDFSVKFYRYTN